MKVSSDAAPAGGETFGGLPDDDRQIHRPVVPLHIARFDAVEVKDIVDEPGQALGFVEDDLEIAADAPATLDEVGVVHGQGQEMFVEVPANELGKAQNRSQGRAQFVGHRGEKQGLEAVELAHADIGFGQFHGLLPQVPGPPFHLGFQVQPLGGQLSSTRLRSVISVSMPRDPRKLPVAS